MRLKPYKPQWKEIRKVILQIGSQLGLTHHAPDDAINPPFDNRCRDSNLYF